MTILTSYEALGLDPEGTSAERMYEGVVSAFEGCCRDFYLSSEASPDAFTLGTDPKFKAKLGNWDQEIRTEFLNALEACFPELREHKPLDVSGFPLDSTGTYRLKKACREIDNDWHGCAEHGAFLDNENGWPYFTTMPTKAQMEEIMADPKGFFMVEVYPK